MSPVFLVEALTVKVSSFAFLPAPLVITSWVSLDDFTVPEVLWLMTAGAFFMLAADYFAAGAAACAAYAATGTVNATARIAALVILNISLPPLRSIALPTFQRLEVRR